ncbi:MAG: response regulator [Gammaproteobacteria bacterium]|nr:response regulator [Gammaproteobacteria bacterium]
MSEKAAADAGTVAAAARIVALERAMLRLQRTNETLMDRVEHRISQEGNAFAAFQTAINLEKTVAERTAELRELNLRLERELELRRKYEAALIRAKQQAEDATRSKTRFVASASHDLRQPLNAAILYLESISPAELDTRNAESLRGVQLALGTLNSLLGTLLDISRLDSGAIHPDPAHHRLAPMLERLAREYGSMAGSGVLRLRMVPRDAVVHTDAALLETVLRNLLSNALKYAGGGRILLAARRRGTQLRVQVSDTGPGIDAQHVSRIFEEFWRAPGAAEGAGSIGLGLSIVERISRLLETRVEVRSSLGRGSTFSLDLPAGDARQLAAPVVAALSHAPATFAGRCVALVDDNEQVLRSMERLLDGWQCRTVAGSSIEEVLTRLIDADLVPDLLLADYHLGNARTGLDALAEISVEFSGPLPAIVVSSDTSPQLTAELQQRGIPFLTKPVEVARLRALMQHLLRGW